MAASPIDETEEFSKKSIDDLKILEQHYQKRVFVHDRNMEPCENTKAQKEAQRKLIIIQRLLKKKIAEQEALNVANEEYMVTEVLKHITEIRFIMNPRTTLNCTFGVTIESLKWQKTDTPLIKFKANVKSNKNGKVITTVEDFTFNLLDIPATNSRK